MAILTISDLSIGFRGPLLLDNVSAQIDPNQRIGLLGRNGAGKTTLMRMLCGEVAPDEGSITIATGKRLAFLQQDVPRDTVDSIRTVVATGWRCENEQAADDHNQWECDHAVEKTLTKMGLDPEGRFESLSSGMKRRVLLARAIVSEPDILLLDEPTNHLDIEAISWLEDFLLRWNGTLIFVTHDRMFLQNLATRILEIDRGRIFDWSCDYETFLKRKEAALDAEEKSNALFDKRLAEEEKWIRQGIKARRTRNQGRVRALKAMREERSERRDKLATSDLQIQEGQRSGNLVIEMKDVSFGYDEELIIDGLTTAVFRGDKIGIIGPNGVGKTTLLRIMLEKLEPHSGSVRTGTNLQVAYFDQLREALDPEETVQHAVGEGYDHITIGDQKKHVLGYLQDFLFPPERSRTQIKFLSGGERNRVLLAKLFAKTANVIVLDEPTNDLDAETLEMLEERLAQYSGTVLLVSHDRAFLNNVVTSTLAFHDGNVKEYPGGYDDFVQQRDASKAAIEARATKSANDQQTGENANSDSQIISNSVDSSGPAKKLSYKDKRELESLPATIEQLESKIANLHETMADPDYYQSPPDKLSEDAKLLSDLEQQLESSFTRWEELETQ